MRFFNPRNLLLALLLPLAAQAQVPDSARLGQRVQALGDVEVRGATAKTDLTAELAGRPAAVTVLGAAYVARQPVASYGDLLRPLAGLSVANYQLGGVGYGIQMRGYTTTEHARDIAFTIDGVPQNQGSSIFTNGYADLNPLLPELIRRIEVVRGPNNPLVGDHALGGSIAFGLAERLPTALTLTGGSFGTARGLATVGFGRADPAAGLGGYAALEGYHSDGYRDNSRDQRLNGLARMSFPLLGGTAAVRVQAYGDDFGSAMYLRRADIDAGRVDLRAAVNPTDGGLVRQQNAVLSYRGANPTAYWSALAYGQRADFQRFRTGSIGGNQRLDRDARTWAGGDLRHTRTFGGAAAGGRALLLAAGLSFRADDIRATRFATVGRVLGLQSQDRQLRTSTPAAYALLEVKPWDALKVSLSARYDWLFYTIRTGTTDAALPGAALRPRTGAFSPKAGAALRLARGLEAFVNAARGFKAPSAYEEILFNPSLGPSYVTSYELGLSADDPAGRWHGLLTGYLSTQTAEVQTDPLGNLLNLGRTRRNGVEAEGRYRLGQGAGAPSVFANYARVVARLRNDVPGQDFVVNTPTYLSALGVDYQPGAANREAPGQFTLSGYGQLIGPKNLSADGAVRSAAFVRLAAKILYERPRWHQLRLFAEGSFYPSREAQLAEMAFLSGGNVLTAPQPPATVTAGLRLGLN